MSYLEKLLDGAEVEWKRLGDISEIYGGLTGKSKDDFVSGNAKYITYKNIFRNIEVDKDYFESVKVQDNENQNIVKYGDILFTGSSETPNDVGMSSAVTKHFNVPIYLNSFCFGVRFNDGVNLIPEFSKYLFRSNFMRSEIIKTASGVTRFNISKNRFKNLSVPIFPLSVQHKIVEILDNFTELTVELTVELTAELTARRQQYEYYRNQLLSFGDGDVEWKTLVEVFEIRNGYTPSKANKEFWEGGHIPWFRMNDLRERGRILSDSQQHITERAVKGKGLFKANSIILATTATIGEHALIIADSLANQQFTNFKIRKSLTGQILPMFAFYYFYVIDEWCKNNVNESSFPSVDISKLKKQFMPIPPLYVQQKIVSILDKFDALTTSLTEGLPREIELRQKQYEYYREKLLSFPKPE